MEQVSPGPNHRTTLVKTEIDGVTLMTVPVMAYEYGLLGEIFNPDWESIFREPIEHMYVINNVGHERGHWHMHRVTTDRYVLIQGEIEIALYDDRPASSTYQSLIKVILVQIGAAGAQGLRIPPGVWHTFRSKDLSFTLLNNKYPKYDSENPDKFVRSFEEAGFEFAW